MKKIRKYIAFFVSVIFISTSIYSSTVNAEEPEDSAALWNWTFEYTGTEQVFKSPYSGIYEFEIYGAQGESIDSNEGGKGGKVTAAIRLSRNEEIIIYVGGTDGYNGGGTGTVSHGGGATDIRQGGNELSDRILVAAGGGGANNIYEGGDGGVNTSTTMDISSEGESSTEGAGGGGGYEGGASGIEHIVEHIHSEYGGSCYAADYHTHKGNESVYGGCHTIQKTKTMNVTHNWHVTGRGDTINRTEEIVQGEGVTHYIKTKYPIVDEHGHTGEIEWCSFATGARSSMQTGWEFVGDTYGYANGRLENEPLNFTFSTGKAETVTYYDLGCGLTTGEITGYHFDCDEVYDEYDVKQSAGGTNYYDEDNCTNAVSEAGIQEGDGSCSIKINTLYNLYFDGVESLNIYYDGIKVKRIYYKGKLIYRE